jgi:hypothetical protein
MCKHERLAACCIYGLNCVHKALKQSVTGLSDCAKNLRLRSRQKRKFKATNSRHDFPIAENLLNQTFTPARPNGARVTDSPDAQRFRDAMAAPDKVSFCACGPEHYQFEDFPFLPRTTGTQHLLACYRIDDIVVTVVRLFGQPLLSLVCVVPAEPFDLVQLEGTVVINDASSRSMDEQKLLQAGIFGE